MKHILLTCLLLVGYVACLYAQEQQQIEVTGVVVDENKLPMIGVNITVQNVAGLGTVTDMDGKYTIKMEPYHRLVFSYIGYESEVVLVKEQETVERERIGRGDGDRYRCTEENIRDRCCYDCRREYTENTHFQHHQCFGWECGRRACSADIRAAR